MEIKAEKMNRKNNSGVNSMKELTEELEVKFGNRAEADVSAAAYTTYRTGGNFEFLVKPLNIEEMTFILSYAKAKDVPVTILGRGSNILVSDSGLPGITIFTGLMNKIYFPELPDTSAGKSVSVRAEAGALWDSFVTGCLRRGFGGYEKTSGIPGSIGGAVRMNAGAYGCETADFLESFTVITPEGKLISYQRREVEFSYRYSGFPRNYTVVSAEFRLQPAETEKLLATRSEILASRRQKQPLDYPSAGSVFRRPAGDYASRLVDICGLKGLSRGGAAVSEKHAGFIINKGGATATDIYRLIREIQKTVMEKTGVQLEPEQVLLGNFENC